MAEISLELQLRTASSPAPEPTLRARHRRFFESKKRRENRSIEERGHHKHKLNKNGTFDTSDSSDDGGASKARVPRPLPPGATPKLAATTSSPARLAPSKPPQSWVTSTLASIPTTSLPIPTRPPITNETPAARLADQKAAPTVPPPQVSKTPVAAPQPTPFPTSSDTPNVSGIPTNIGGFGGPGINGFTRHASSGSTISGGMVTGIVLGVVGLIIAAVLAIIFIRKRRLRRLSYPRGALPPMSQASSGKPPSVITRARQRAESILWGSQATVGTRTEASFPASTIPASMKPGGKHNKDGLNMLTPPLRYPDPTRNPTPNLHQNSGSTEWDRFTRTTSLRSPGPTMQSISGMTPPFRNVDSWVARGNGGGELEPRGPYARLN